MKKLRLGINIDHVATLRNARNRTALAHPDLVSASRAAIKGGADGITFHLREDRRHILDADVRRLKKNLKIPLNLEIAATEEMKDIALHMRPHAVCLVPEKRQELTTEGGLDAAKGGKHLRRIIRLLVSARIRVALFIDPEPKQVAAAHGLGAVAVELHTGAYCNMKGAGQKRELRRLQTAARQAHGLGLEVHAGHGLTYDNVVPIAAIPEIVELNIGHFLIGEAMFVGLEESIRKMRRILDTARCQRNGR